MTVEPSLKQSVEKMDVSDVNDTNKDTEASETPVTSVSPALLEDIGVHSVASLCACLTDMYEQMDDTLFDLADRAHNNNEQALYFDSMREIRLHRKSAEKVFQQSLENAFNKLLSNEPSVVSQEQLEAETLALVDNDDMEIDVAISNMVHRARCEHPTGLLQLTMRFDAILPQKCDEDNLPLDPKQIVTAFTQSTQDLEIDIKIRIILYKEFEKHILRHLDEMLFDANEMLIEAGVLPDIRSTLTKKRRKKSSLELEQREPSESKARPISDDPAKEATAVQFSTLQSLLAATDNLQAESVYIQSDSNQPSLPQQALFDWLSNIQHQQIQSETSKAGTPSPLTVRQEIFDFIKQAGAQNPNNRLNKVDDNVINVVDMIFEFILDQDIASPLAALIGRLQIPILKVAIHDKSFFDSHKHPARKMLNAIAHASLGWNVESNYQNDPLYKKLDKLVHTILSTPNPSTELFEKLEADFEQYTQQESQRSERLVERTVASEEGKAQTEINKKLIAQLIKDRIHGKSLPPVVIGLLNGPWQKLLLLIVSRQGKDSDAWRDALSTADDLIWSVHMHTDTKARERWVALIPTLLDNLNAGLDTIAHSEAETEKLLAELWEIHSQMLKHKGEDNPVKTVKVDLTHVKSDAVISPLMKRKVPPEDVRELRQLVSGFKEGQWFEFIQVGGNKISCRLIRKIRATDAYIFANRYGAKTSAVSKDQLALYFYDKKAQLLESGPLIDRALQAVMLRLKNSSN